jgi:hypothetical protein
MQKALGREKRLVRAEDAGSLSEMAEALLLDAALENIPYGFCVWSPQFRLVMWNKNWRDIYGFASDAVYRGMSLEEVVQLSAQMGNHPDQSAAEFYESYTADLLANRSGARTKSQEVVHGGRTIETAHVYSTALGWVVTHEDITDEIARTEVVQKRKLRAGTPEHKARCGGQQYQPGPVHVWTPRGGWSSATSPMQRIYDLPDKLLRPGTHARRYSQPPVRRGHAVPAARGKTISAWRRDVINRARVRQEHPRTQ